MISESTYVSISETASLDWGFMLTLKKTPGSYKGLIAQNFEMSTQELIS
jgi:hypothetical protein